MDHKQENKLLYNGKIVGGFTARCEKCGSNEVTIDYEFRDFGDYDGYEQSLYLRCRNCQNCYELMWK